MALIAHWPLNGNTDDYSGNGNHGVNNGVIWVDGKIGPAASFNVNNASGVNIQNNNFTNIGPNYTFSVWLRIKGNHRNYNGAIISSGNWNSQSWSFGVNQDNTAIDPAGNGYNKWISYTLPINEWFHLTSVRTTNGASVYIDGELIGTVGWVTQITQSSDTNTYIGRETYAGGHFSFNGDINDLRIYNHALSEKEIKELSKAKILHYTFDDMREPTTNLIINPLFNSTSNWSLSTNGGGSFSVADGYGKITVGTAGSYNYIAQHLTKSNTNKTLTLSAKFKNNVIGNCALRLVVFDGDSVPAQPISTISLDGSGGTVSGSVTASYSGTATAYRLDILSGSYYSGLSDIDIEVTEVQLEEKPYATEFVNGTRTARVNDYSGFFNHSDPLTETTTPQWIPEAKIGSGAYRFNGLNNFIKTAIIPGSENFTVSIWFKPHVTSSGNRIYWGSGSDKIILNQYNNNMQWYMKTSLSSIGYVTTSLQYTVNEWNHAVLRYDGSTVMFFLNGINDNTSTRSINGYSNSSAVNIGTNYNQSSSFFDGEIDDFRFYATALSDEDILGLYRNRVSFDNKGNVFNYHIENNVITNKVIEQDPSGSTHAGDWFNRFKPNKNILIKSVSVYPYFTGELETILKKDWDDQEIIQIVKTEVESSKIQRIELNMFCRANEIVLLGKNTTTPGTPMMRSDVLIGGTSSFSDENIEFFSSGSSDTNTAERIYYFFDWEYEIVDKININSTGTMTFNEINQIDHNLNQETTKQRLKEDGTLEIDGYIIQN